MTYTEWFQSWAGFGFGWFLSNLTLILLIALPLMLAVAMIIYADRKIRKEMTEKRNTYDEIQSLTQRIKNRGRA